LKFLYHDFLFLYFGGANLLLKSRKLLVFIVNFNSLILNLFFQRRNQKVSVRIFEIQLLFGLVIQKSFLKSICSLKLPKKSVLRASSWTLFILSLFQFIDSVVFCIPLFLVSKT